MRSGTIACFLFLPFASRHQSPSTTTHHPTGGFHPVAPHSSLYLLLHHTPSDQKNNYYSIYPSVSIHPSSINCMHVNQMFTLLHQIIPSNHLNNSPLFNHYFIGRHPPTMCGAHAAVACGITPSNYRSTILLSSARNRRVASHLLPTIEQPFYPSASIHHPSTARDVRAVASIIPSNLPNHSPFFNHRFVVSHLPTMCGAHAVA